MSNFLGISQRIERARHTGKLILSELELDIFTKDILTKLFHENKNSNGQQETFKWWEVKELLEVQANHCELEQIEVGAFIECQIKVMNLNYNNLSSFPPALNDLASSLLSLSMCHNKLDNLHMYIYNQ